jgi:hypothetical protein
MQCIPVGAQIHSYFVALEVVRKPKLHYLLIEQIFNSQTSLWMSSIKLSLNNAISR